MQGVILNLIFKDITGIIMESEDEMVVLYQCSLSDFDGDTVVMLRNVLISRKWHTKTYGSDEASGQQFTHTVQVK